MITGSAACRPRNSTLHQRVPGAFDATLPVGIPFWLAPVGLSLLPWNRLVLKPFGNPIHR
jgi:hypothetical protein